jgi:hypothetical protein
VTFAEVLDVLGRAGAVDESEGARTDLAALGLDAGRVAALDVVRVLPAVGDLPTEAATWRASGRRYVVRVFDSLTATVGLRAFPAAEPAPSCFFADAGGLAALRAPGGPRRALVVADGLPRFLRAALRPAAAPCTLGVVSAADWTAELAARVATRARSLVADGTADLRAVFEGIAAPGRARPEVASCA